MKNKNLEKINEEKDTKINSLKAELERKNFEIKEIKSSYSWKIIMFLRLKILDIFIPNRKKYIDKIKKIYRIAKKIIKKLKPSICISYEQKKFSDTKPLISIIIPCFNYGNYIEEAITSVLNQTFQNFEIIIVDGGSTDINTVSFLKKLKKPKTKIYFREGRHLVGDNRNYGINLAKGKYICCIDPDDIIRPTYLEKAIFLLETQNYDLISTSIETFGTEDKIYYHIQNPTLNDMVKNNHIATVAIFKKKLWQKANGYYDWGLEEKYVYEDWDIWVRMSALGAKFFNINEPLMLYRLHGTNSLSGNKKNKTIEEQRKEIMKHNENYINSLNFIKSFFLNKIIKYKVKNKYINIRTKNKIDILFALPFTILGGADKIFTNLVDLLKINNIKSIITTTVEFDNSLHDTTQIYEKTTNKIYHLPRFLNNLISQKDFVDYLIESYNIKCIFLGGSQFFYKNLKYIKNKYPHIKIIDIQFNTDIHFKNNLKNQKYIDKTIAENKEVYDKFIINHNIKKNQIELISYGVETDVLKPLLNKPKIPNNLPKNKFIVSYIGRLSEEKNPEFIVKLAKKFLLNEKIFFILAGPGPQYEKIKRLIDSQSLNNIYMPGTINSQEYLSYTDLLILPSIIDGNPIVIKEAFSMGVPVIASNVGGIPFIIKDNETGFICETNNINQFSDAINKILESPELLKQMKINCRNYAVKNLDLKKVNEKFIKLFKNILN